MLGRIRGQKRGEGHHGKTAERRAREAFRIQQHPHKLLPRRHCAWLRLGGLSAVNISMRRAGAGRSASFRLHNTDFGKSRAHPQQPFLAAVCLPDAIRAQSGALDSSRIDLEPSCSHALRPVPERPVQVRLSASSGSGHLRRGGSCGAGLLRTFEVRERGRKGAQAKKAQPRSLSASMVMSSDCSSPPTWATTAALTDSTNCWQLASPFISERTETSR